MTSARTDLGVVGFGMVLVGVGGLLVPAVVAAVVAALQEAGPFVGLVVALC
jgi:hypothetical protein